MGPEHLLSWIAAAVMFAGGCRVAAPAHAAPAAQVQWERGEWVKTELYFGLSRTAGAEISDAEFAAFLAQVVTPRFPEGLSVLEARGQWRDSAGRTVREPARVVVL